MLTGLWRSLQVRIIAWSFIPASIILTAVALVTFYAYQRVGEDLVLGRNQELTRLYASQMASEVGQYADLLEGVARNGDVYRGDAVAQRAALEKAANRLVVFDGGVVLLDKSGRIVATQPDRPGALGLNWSNRAYYSKMLRTSTPVYSDVVDDGPGGARVVVVAVPVTGEQGDFQGTLAGMFRLGASSISAFYGGIVKLRIGEGGTIYLLDSAGTVIYHSDSQRIGTDASRNPGVQELMSRKTSQVNGGALGGSDGVATFAAVPGTPWGLVTEENWNELMQPSQAYRQFLLVLLAMGVIVPALVTTIGVRRITGPIMQLTMAARAVAAGDFDTEIDVHTGDEVEDLAKQFSAMSAELRDSYANLERKVGDRTRELATLNAIAAVVSESLKLEQVLPSALEKTIELLDLAQGGIYLLDEREQLHLSEHRGLSAEAVSLIAVLKKGEGFSGVVAQSGEPIVVDDVPNDPRLPPGMLAAGAGSSMVCVPLISSGRVLGTMFVLSESPRLFTSRDVELLVGIGHQIGVAVENARLYEQAKQLAVLDERNRLARDLHDSVTQALYSVTLYAEAASRLLSAGDVATASEHIAELRATGQQALREMRSLIFELRPSLLEKEGLLAALQSRLEAVESRAGLGVELRTEGIESLPAAVENGLYGIAQEALNNVLKHSRAKSVRLSLVRSGSKVTMDVTDDGEGFDLASVRERGGLGLRGMEERAAACGARMKILSAPGDGTTVRVEVGL